MGVKRTAWAPDGFACVIIEANRGIEYTHQTGGVACHHPTAKGFCIPLFCGLGLDEELARLHPGCCGWGPLSLEEADEIDVLLQRFRVRLKVDRDRLDASEEAWVAVVVTEDEEFEWTGMAGRKGWLTWTNCD